jgi:hypothetical protein
MNLGLLLAVLGRFKYLVLAGFLLAAGLSTVSAVRLTFDGVTPHLEYRGQEEWRTGSTLFVTQKGFPWGRTILEETAPVGPRGEERTVERYADGGRFQGLAVLYAQLARADAVRALMLRDGPLDGDYSAEVVRSDDGITLPLIRIIGIGRTAEHARTMAGRATKAFLLHFSRLQEQNKIPQTSRVVIEPIDRPAEAVLVEGRRMTRPVFMFVLVMTATIVLAFALENLRPRPLAGADAPTWAAGASTLPEPTRKSA